MGWGGGGGLVRAWVDGLVRVGVCVCLIFCDEVSGCQCVHHGTWVRGYHWVGGSVLYP